MRYELGGRAFVHVGESTGRMVIVWPTANESTRASSSRHCRVASVSERIVYATEGSSSAGPSVM